MKRVQGDKLKAFKQTDVNLNCSHRYQGLVEFIVYRYNRAVEIGIGHFPDVALLLLQNDVRVFATDIKSFRYRGIKVITDDITEPDLPLYDGLDLIYSLRPPPELVPYMIRISHRLSTDLIIKPLSSEHCDGQLVCNENTSFFLWSHR
jgi:uncharacterized UPF0146 family protein